MSPALDPGVQRHCRHVAAAGVVSLATDERVVKYCRRMARDKCALDPENFAAQGQLGVLLAERRGELSGPDPVRRAKDVAWNAIRSAYRAEIRDRLRCKAYLERKAARGASPRGSPADTGHYLDTLTAREREAIRLRLWEGLEESEMAARLGCSPAAAKSSYQRAVRRLRGHFA